MRFDLAYGQVFQALSGPGCRVLSQVPKVLGEQVPYRVSLQLSSTQQALANPDVGTAVGDRERHLASLAAATALVHVQVVADGIYVFQRGEQVTAELHGTQQFGYLAVAYHIALARGEGEHLHARHPAVPVLGVDALLYL